MIYLCCFHIVTATIKKTEAYLRYSFTTKVKTRKTLGLKPGRRPIVWSLWFVFYIPLTWTFRAKLSKLHIFACRINDQHKPEHQRFEWTDFSL